LLPFRIVRPEPPAKHPRFTFSTGRGKCTLVHAWGCPWSKTIHCGPQKRGRKLFATNL